MTEWSLSNQLDFLSLRIEECDRLFHDLIMKLCSPDRVNVAAQISLCDEVQALNNRVDSQTESIQKLLEEVRQNGAEQDLSIVDIWGRKIPEQKRALGIVGEALGSLLKGEGADKLAAAVESINYELLQIEKPTFDKSTFEPITFEYLRDRFDHCLCLLQNIFNYFLRRNLTPETANEQMASIKAFNADFELQKQNISLYESQLFENLSSFQNGEGNSIENELNLLQTFSDTIDLWTKLPLNQISGTITQTDAPRSLHNNLYDLFKDINFEAIGIESPTASELLILRFNLGYFRPKFQTRNLAWMWVNKLKLVPKDDEPLDFSENRRIPVEAIPEYYIQLQQFMQQSEAAIDTFIENLLTCEPNRETFDVQFNECDKIKSALQAQRGQMRTLNGQLTKDYGEEAVLPGGSDDVIDLEQGVPNAPSNYEIYNMRTNVSEWIKLVDLWLRVLDSLTGLLSHMAKTASGAIDDVVDSLRQMIERDLFIPASDGGNDMEQ
ncbi:hypothetical protein FO519_006786 [Halicephalobus sp. NKZ332]|nr:hypothetical protein FO519_006786 [Halicephalobus sp. NKZ332]